MAPLLGPSFKRLRIWWAMSGKAMNAVPAARTARVVTRGIEKREGHVARVCGLFIALRRCTCRAKAHGRGIERLPPHKRMRCKDLVRQKSAARYPGKISQKKGSATQCILNALSSLNARKHQAHGGFWASHGRG